ncbi:MAG: tetratricopeptide repeat protein, partial [Crocosphaera sp.]
MKLKFALNHNGIKIRTLDELRKYCNIDQLLKDYRDGKLRRWLEALKNLDNLVLAIENISAEDDLELAEELVRIIDIDRQVWEEYKVKIESYQKFFESGYLHYNLSEYDKAIADYTKAIELNPNYAYAYNNRGLAYYNLKEYQKA